MKQVRLNSLEVWIAERALPVFGVVALAIIAGTLAIFVVFLNQGAVERQVNVLRPQVTTINRAICDRRSLENRRKARRCAERIRVGLVNCRRYDRCRAAFLSVLTYPPPARGAASSPEPSSGSAGDTRGGDAFQPSTGHQQPSPGKQPGHKGGGKHTKAPSPPPSPSPALSVPPAPEPPPQPGNSEKAPHGSSSGVAVEVCAASKCAEAKVDVEPKGLIP